MNKITKSVELRSREGKSLGTVTADLSPKTFSLDEMVDLTLVFMPESAGQYSTVYRIESPGFSPNGIPVGNFTEQPTRQHQFKAGKFEASGISAVFYNCNHEAGSVDFDFEKSGDG